MNSIFYLSFIILLLSCSRQELGNIEIPIEKLNYQLIQGDWVGEGANNRMEESLSFEDSLCSGFYYFGDFVKYEIKHDTLEINKRDSQFERTTFYLFRIKFDTYDQLKLKPIDRNTIDFFRQIGIESDSIVFHKVKSKNKIKPDKIKFYSSVCFGTCPSLYLEIDSERKIKFYGEWNTELEGGYEGVLSEELYNQILTKIHNLPLDKIESFNQTGTVDAQTVTFILEYNGNKIRCVFQASEIDELNFIRHKLSEVYKFVKMKKTGLSIGDFDSELNNSNVMFPVL